MAPEASALPPSHISRHRPPSFLFLLSSRSRVLPQNPKPSTPTLNPKPQVFLLAAKNADALEGKGAQGKVDRNGNVLVKPGPLSPAPPSSTLSRNPTPYTLHPNT